jgi:dephospho-CoA kinase
MSGKRQNERDTDRDHGAPFVIGLTGPIASGKSTVAEILRRWGAEAIDADRVYHDLLAPGSDLARGIRERFGAEVLRPDGSLDRPALGQLVFRDPTALADLEALTHPAVVSEIREQIARSTAPVVVVEAIKLIQSGLLDDVDLLWVVTADPEVRVQRLMERSDMTTAEARARVEAVGNPLPDEVSPDAVIDNSGALCQTELTVRRALSDAGVLLDPGSGQIGVAMSGGNH